MLTGGEPTDSAHGKQQSLSSGTAAHSLPFSSSSLCLSASSSPWPHLSLFLCHLFIFCIFSPPPPLFFAPEVSISPPPTLVSTPPLSVLSLLRALAAMWSRRGSRVTEAGPFGVTSSLSHSRGAAEYLLVCACVRACESAGALFTRAKRGVRG